MIAGDVFERGELRLELGGTQARVMVSASGEVNSGDERVALHTKS